ncbi:MAG: VanW family protein [Actinomycetota bacterium]
MRGARRLVLSALVAVAGLLALVGAAWALDTSRSDGEVLRNVTLGGRDIGGLTRDRLAAVVHELAARYPEAAVRVDAPGGGFTFGPGELGLTVDEPATVEAALGTGRGGNPLDRLRGWATSFLDPLQADVVVHSDEDAVYRIVAERDTARTAPTEPSVTVEDGELTAVEGRPGRGIDPAAVLDALPAALGGGAPFTVEVGRGPVPPRFGIAAARRLVAAGEAATADPLPVTVDGKPGSVGPDRLRAWLRSEPTDAGLRLVVDEDEATAGLAKALPGVGTPAVETTFTVVDGVPQVVPGQVGSACCASDAGARVDQALQDRLAGRAGAGPLVLPTKAVEPELTVDEANTLGIKEEVGTFTTNHAPNQPRVANIHRIADLVRGQVIMPGRTFSVNGLVGERTPEKGFVVDAVIEDGRFTESVGGGISQFATTAFNAAFFAGLEFAEYQSHSIYISRYPYGREATLSFPHPDLRIRNPSPHGVLIWPTYTGRSVTVTLYSTKWVEAAQTNQTSEPRGPCTRVRTERTRRFLADNTTKVDHVSALYRPAEGVNCT